MFACPKCKADLPADRLNIPDFQGCVRCQSPLRTVVFPALFRNVTGSDLGETVISEGESSCFFHEGKRAVVSCEGCGRFLCSLCDVEFGGKHICATCLESGKKKGKMQNLQDSRVRYDSIALALSFLPVLAWPVTIVTAPMAIFIVIRHWKSPKSLLPHRPRLKMISALILAICQIVAWIVFITFLVTSK